jgi:hypothetical protein
MWSGPWQIVARATGNNTELDDGRIVSLAYGELDYSFRVFSIVEIWTIIGVIIAGIGLPSGYIMLRRSRAPKEQSIDNQRAPLQPSKTKREIMAEPPYREHSAKIGLTISKVWEGSSRQLTSCSYENGEFRLIPGQLKTSKEYPLIDDARKHLEIVKPEVFTQFELAEKKAVEICGCMREAYDLFVMAVTSPIIAACPSIPLLDKYDDENLHYCYKRNLVAAISAELQGAPSSRNQAKVHSVTTTITDAQKNRKTFTVHTLELSAYGIAWGSEDEMNQMKTTLDQIVRDKSIEDSFTKMMAFQKQLHTPEAEALHEMTRKIANDSKEKPLGGPGCCSTCSWLFEDATK